MPEIITEAFGLHNLPVTVLLLIMVVYWLMVIIGAADVDMDGGGADVHAHADVDVSGDAHGHGHVPVGAHVDAHGHGHSHSSSSETTPGPGSSGFWQQCSRLLHLGEVPLMIVLSVLSLFMWTFSIMGNYYFNGTPGNRSAGMALLLLIPNLIVSLLLSRIVLSPLGKLIRRMDTTESESETVIGREARVVSSSVTEGFGQIEIDTKSVPVTVNARVSPGSPAIPKGAAVIVYDAAPDHVYYLVRPLPAETA